MKLTFIYLNETEKTTATKQCYKNKVSLSTLADIVIFTTYYVITHYAKDPNIKELLLNEYIQKSNMDLRTSIKPKCYKETEVLFGLIQNKDKFATNCMKIYINKRIEDYVNEEGKKHYYNMINEKLQSIKEIFWNYNAFVRSQNRNLKENKEYYKRRIAILEGN